MFVTRKIKKGNVKNTWLMQEKAEKEEEGNKKERKNRKQMAR